MYLSYPVVSSINATSWFS